VHWQYTPYNIPLLIATAVMAALALFAWRRRTVSGATPFALLMLAVAEWSLGYVLELGNADLPTKVFWAKVQYLGIVTVPLTWLAFVLQYTGRARWLTRRNLALLAIVPLITLLLVWTNEIHGLIWSEVIIDTSGPFPMLDLSYGALFWIHTAYSYLLLLLGTLLLIQILIRLPRLYRGQAVALLIGSLAPWVGNALYISGLSPFPHLDLTPFAFTLSGLAVAWGLFRHRLLDIVPVAYDAVIESLSDGVIVLDIRNRIVDLNPVAQHLIGRPLEEVIGQPASRIFSDWPDLIKRYRDVTEAQAEVVLGEGKTRRYYDLRISSLRDWQNRLIGRLIVWHDITAHKRAEKALHQRFEQLQAIYRLSNAVSRAETLEEIYQKALDCLQCTLNVDRTALLLSDADGVMRFKAWHGLSEDYRKAVEGHSPWSPEEKNPQPVLIPDVEEEPSLEALRAVITDEGIRALGFIPLVYQGQLLGKFMLYYDEPHRFDDEEVRLAQAIASHIAFTIQRQRAEKVLRDRERYLTLLNDITRAALETPDLRTMLQTLADRLSELIDADGCYITLWDEARQMTIPAAAYGELREMYPLQRPEPGEVTMTESVLRAGRPLVVEDVFNTPYLSPRIAALFPARSLLGLPLIAGGRKLGAVLIAFNRPHRFTPDEIARGEQAARQIALAVAKARLLEEAKGHAAKLATLYETGKDLTSTLELDALLQFIVERSAQLTKADKSLILLVDTETEKLTKVVGFGFAPGQIEDFTYQEVQDGISGWVLREKTPTISEDILTDPRNTGLALQRAKQERERGQSIAVAPLLIKDKAIGTLTVINNVGKPIFSQDDLDLVVMLASQAAVAIENARLYEETKRRMEELAALQEVTRAVAAELTLDEVLNLVAHATSELLEAETAAVVLVNPDGQTRTYAACYGLQADALRGIVRPVHIGAQGYVIRTGKSLLINDVSADEHVSHDFAERLGLHSAIIAPLMAKGKITGCLTAFNKQEQRSFTDDDLRLLYTFADQAAIAIENARLFEETRRLLAKTQEQARQVQRILDTVAEGMLLLDAERRIVLVNPAAQEYLAALTEARVGDTLTHLGGQPIATLLEPPSEGLWHEVTVEEPFRRIFEVSARPMEAEPEAGGWVLVIRDVTEQREIQQRLQQQERLAAVGQLAAGIAHDFNNLLTGIIGFAQLLQIREDIPETAKADLEIIVEQGQRAAHLIQQILDFSRKSITQRRPFDLAPFLKETAKFLERTIPENIHIILEIVPGDYLINADPTQIQQMLTNLAVNARDAMPEGGELRLRLARFTLSPGERPPFPGMPAGEWVALSVSDTGMGIRPEHLPHIFEPFFTTKGPGRGAGLGLAQVYGIVKQHEGFIDVETEVGKGTTFTIYLPALEEVKTATQEVPEIPVEGQGETILLVEDERAVLDVTRAMLEQLGYQVLAVGSGAEALQVYTQHRDEIALVLADLVMPEIGGVELYHALRAQNPNVKMVVMTGYPLGEEEQQLLSQGIIAWVQKPLNITRLAQTVNEVLKQ